MPNWCANRLFFRAEPGNITDIRHLLRGSLSPFYQQAVQEGIHLFVAGCAGLLQPVDDFHYAPYPVLTQAGRGIVSPENLAFTRWLGMLQSGVELDEKNCRTLHEIWLQSGIGERRWESLSGDAQAAVGLLYDRKHFDWNGLWHKTDTPAWWNRLCDNPEPVTGNSLDMRLLLPARLDTEINGFNGGLLENIPSSYYWYLERYGTKWPQGYDLNISACGADFIQADFDTPWSPPCVAVMEELSRRCDGVLEHWYAEQGCDFCGYARYDRGEQEEEVCGSLEREQTEDGEDSLSDVTGPEWILNNVAHFGG
ncbi:DUF1281 domain-containing protein [Salmonella enterica subsp. enterica]|nr:DUF1281 domain-containing protein [Salmonella enterica subsp. enterica serovar Litchfield]EDV1959520.1 DUF1281 domain-containing protein [Salmonella enterica subsp. enterica serovar Litchfield]